MTELHLLNAQAAATALRDAGQHARGFLGVDPVAQNDTLLAGELTRLGSQVYRTGSAVGGAVVGYAPNHAQPRQAYVASTSADAGPVRAMLTFLANYRRCNSYVALLPAGSPAVPAFTGCGFAEIGVLREHRYQSGGYQDVLVYFAKVEDTCRS
jgi:hypothetical protein